MNDFSFRLGFISTLSYDYFFFFQPAISRKMDVAVLYHKIFKEVPSKTSSVSSKQQEQS